MPGGLAAQIARFAELKGRLAAEYDAGIVSLGGTIELMAASIRYGIDAIGEGEPVAMLRALQALKGFEA